MGIICGDALAELAYLESESVDLVVTSPPYDNLRSYNGYEWDFEGIAKELVRVLRSGGVIVWVVGDATVKGSETGTSFKQALYFKELGLNLHDTMVYQKSNPIPLTHNRYEQSFEYMFVFSKGKPKTFNPIKEDKLHPQAAPGNFYKSAKDSHTTKHSSLNKTHTKRKTNVWGYIVGHNYIKHPAVFPEPLVYDHIISWSNRGDLVLDPFNGSGTTTKVARDLGRGYIGIDISQEYCDIAIERLSEPINKQKVT